jgi:hypothetical protein
MRCPLTERAIRLRGCALPGNAVYTGRQKLSRSTSDAHFYNVEIVSHLIHPPSQVAKDTPAWLLTSVRYITFANQKLDLTEFDLIVAAMIWLCSRGSRW